MVTCEKCGAEMPKGSILCIKCGNRFTDSKIEVIKEKQKELSKAKSPPQPSKPKSPYLEKKKTSPISFLIMPLLIVILIAALVFVMSSQKPAECKESWTCTGWSACVKGNQSRFCADETGCRTETAKPLTMQGCAGESLANATPIELANCTANLKACSNESECCGKFCVHRMCQNSSIFCGDGYCDAGEGCLSCTYDCSICPGERDLAQNFYTSPVPYNLEKNLTRNGYVIIRYFYANSCNDCFTPVNIENQLRDLAANYKDIVVVISLDAQKYSNDAERYELLAGINGVVVKPFIFIEGRKDLVYSIDSLYGYGLKAKLQDGDVLGDLTPLICLRTDYCNFEGGKIVRA